MANNEFLPLCDVLFNIISLLWYFCNVVFDLVFCYALFNHQKFIWFCASLSCIVISLVVNQIISLRCYFKTYQYKSILNSKNSSLKRTLIIFIHLIQCGVLWRYIKLFIPVDIRYVKQEVRDLCLLRLIHAFCEAAPLLLMQLYLLFKEPGTSEIKNLILVSSVLSLFSMCWALASFSKNVRLQNVHRLVFTWLGVIFQLFWRLGTVGSRVVALTLYASLYGKWLFLVLGLHWMSMFLWLISPKNVFHGEKISKYRKIVLAILIAFVYIFSYINLQQLNHRQKMATFYIVMLLENTLLVAVWLAEVWPDFNFLVPLLISISFLGGLCFMGLYYKIFHVRRLAYWSGGRDIGCEYNGSNTSTTRLPNNNVRANENAGQKNDLNKLFGQNLSLNYHEKIPGVFNCRFSSPYANTAKRKKKKPTTFVPPPSVIILPNSIKSCNNSENEPQQNAENKGYDFLMHTIEINTADKCVPFWKRPLSSNSNREKGLWETENNSIGSKVNIQHKLKEKKQKQLAELKVIEEEIKQGKIQRTSISAANVPHSSLQPIPRTKRHIESFILNPTKPLSTSLYDFTYHLLPPPVRWEHSRVETPEIVLAPHFLDNDKWEKFKSYTYSISDDDQSELENKGNDISGTTSKRHNNKMSSDVDSQMSLPRSFTLPREFKYCKVKKNDHIQQLIRSTNSSDGDVDSADESTTQQGPATRRRLRQCHSRHVTHETKL